MAINWTGSYDTKLLRIISGQLHLLLLQQGASTLFSKPLHTLTDEEKTQVRNSTMAAVLDFAEWATEETLSMPPGGLDPSGKAH